MRIQKRKNLNVKFQLPHSQSIVKPAEFNVQDLRDVFVRPEGGGKAKRSWRKKSALGLNVPVSEGSLNERESIISGSQSCISNADTFESRVQKLAKSSLSDTKAITEPLKQPKAPEKTKRTFSIELSDHPRRKRKVTAAREGPERMLEESDDTLVETKMTEKKLGSDTRKEQAKTTNSLKLKKVRKKVSTGFKVTEKAAVAEPPTAVTTINTASMTASGPAIQPEAVSEKPEKPTIQEESVLNKLTSISGGRIRPQFILTTIRTKYETYQIKKYQELDPEVRKTATRAQLRSWFPVDRFLLRPGIH